MSEKQLLVEELHAPARRNFSRRRVIVHGYDDLWQADVVEMRPYTRFNRGYHYILTVIDVLSKHAWAVPLKAKSGSEVAIAIAKIIQKDGRCPKNLWINLLPHLMSEYNARKHRTTGMRPIDVTPAIAKKLLTTVYSHIKIAAPARFKVGDSRTNPVTYVLEDFSGKPIAGGFYEYELQRVANPDVYLVEKILRRKGDDIYVKWLGFDGSHNSWIHKDTVI
ncbi:uncharacterized protein LOC118644922 [Monomorium pharaonis]|uniref:uncharacterized protein LOC118644922 n=1 Tax=Monomorium pharaonis TaxID=307658 RepID=UPI0017469FDF|nr:uncharacterized protein LOC118644922 [Monomorium pharaonis]